MPTTSNFWAAAMARSPSLQQEPERLFEQTLDVLEEARAHGPVHHAVVAGDGYLHAAAGGEGPVLHHRALEYRAHRQDGAFGGIDDGRELLDVEHAEIGDREGGPGQLGGAELARPRPLGEVARLHRDLHERLDVAVAQHRGDEAALERHREPDVGAVVLAN